MNNFSASVDLNHAGRAMYQLASELFPICRSITGNGIRKTLKIIQRHIPLQIHEVPTGTQVFDWTIPKEWNVRDAYIRNSIGEKVVDFQESNLHLMNYSIPVHKKMSLSELREHLYFIPDRPDWIPYRTSYYKEDWGFCLSFNKFKQLTDGEYEVCIDTSLEDGHLTYGEYYLAGQTSDEVLFSCHCCHPSLGNDNLSGMVLTTFLASLIRSLPPKYSYRFLFIPGTIGSITWLALNQADTYKIKHGLVVACVGDAGNFTYKKSRRGDAEIDRIAAYVLKRSEKPYELISFSPYGYDERQYCSPGFNLPIGSLTRTPHSRYPEYHTSADNLDLMRPEFLAGSLEKYLEIISILENNQTYFNTSPMCEPQLGKRGLYSTIGGKPNIRELEMALLWVLNYSDGDHSLLDISEKSGFGFDLIQEASSMLVEHELLEEARYGNCRINAIV